MMDYAKSFYNGKAWRSTQAAYMTSQSYVCERCGNAARIVHHIKHLTPQNIGDPAIALGWDNLEALCIECHNIEHMTRVAIAEGLRFDGHGNVLPL